MPGPDQSNWVEDPLRLHCMEILLRLGLVEISLSNSTGRTGWKSIEITLSVKGHDLSQIGCKSIEITLYACRKASDDRSNWV